MTGMLGLMLFLLVTGAWGASPEALETTVLRPKYRVPEELIPLIQPYLSKDQGEEAQAIGQTIVLRARPSSLSEIRGLLAQVDRQPGRLNIRVKRRSNDGGSGSRQAIRVSRRGLRGSGIVLSDQSSVQSSDTETSIAALEGEPARILGQFGDSGRALLVTARRTGSDGVTLDITQGSQHGAIVQGVNGSASPSQTEHTVVRGKVGEWIDIGGVVESGGGSDSALLSRGQGNHGGGSGIWVKVDP